MERMTSGNSTGVETERQWEDAPRTANHLMLRVKDEREETGATERLQEQN